MSGTAGRQEHGKKVAALISGRGSNMRALVEAQAQPGCPYEIVAVISNVPDAAGLDYARQQGIATAVIDHREFDSREAFEEMLHETLLVMQAELVACAGFMRIMTAEFVQRWEGRMLNIHPSLLPLFKGLHTHRRVLEAGVRIHGATVHFVTAELDGGPIIIQGAVPVLADDTEETLAQRVLRAEHAIYPAALWEVAAGNARLENGRVILRDWPFDESTTLTAPMAPIDFSRGQE